MKIVSFNIHKGVGWGIRRFTLDQIRIQLRELNPHIVLLQEIRGTQFEYLAEEIWPHFIYGKNASYPKGHHGNAILSQFPIHFSNNLDLTTSRYEQRGLLHTIIDDGQDHHIHLLCVHLGLFKTHRRTQFEKVTEYIQSQIPANEPVILGGDFNDWSGNITKPLIQTLHFQEAFLNTYGNYARTFPAWAPFFRLDRFYTRGFQVNEATCLTQGSWRYLSDHIAIQIGLQLSIEL